MLVFILEKKNKTRDYHVPVIVHLIYISNDQKSETARQIVYTQCSIYCKRSHVEWLEGMLEAYSGQV
jgi:hypothetical protein